MLQALTGALPQQVAIRELPFSTEIWLSLCHGRGKGIWGKDPAHGSYAKPPSAHREHGMEGLQPSTALGSVSALTTPPLPPAALHPIPTLLMGEAAKWQLWMQT